MTTGDSGDVGRARLFRSFVESSQDAFLAVHHDGTIEYASPALRSLLGYEPASVVGKNVVDWLRGDDLERALVQLGESAGHLARGVTRFDVEAADGTWVPVEIAGSAVTDGQHDLLGLCARDGRDQAFIEAVLMLVIEGASRDAALAAVINTIGWQSMHSIVAIDWLDDTGRHQVKSGDFDDALGGPETTDGDPEADPWTRSRQTLQAQRGGVTDEGGWVRAAAELAGVDSYWIQPVLWSSRHVAATITIWTTAEHPIDVHAYGMGLARILVELILRWTEHVAEAPS
ncbi:MAG: PAS domain S-box protein [Acidimicrobiales bacterium]